MQTVTTPSVDERSAVSLPSEGVPEIYGRILYVERDMGFAMKFDELTAEQIEALATVLGAPPAQLLQRR